MTGLDSLLPAPSDLGDQLEGFPWPANVEHISASSIKTFSACPEQFRRRYLLGEKQAPAAAALWGRADHAAAGFNYGQKVDSHQDRPVEDVKEKFAAELDSEVEQAGGINELDWTGAKLNREPVKGVSGRNRAIADVKDRGVMLVERYHLDVAPAVQPLAVEEPFELRLEGVPVPIIGYIDLPAEGPPVVTEKGETVIADRAARIVEKKTAAKRASKPEPDWSFQTALYQLARWLPVEYQVSVKTQDPYVLHADPNLAVKASTARKRFAERIVRSLVLELGWCYLTFGADEPWPAARALLHQWRCGYCGYEPTCPWRRG